MNMAIKANVTFETRDVLKTDTALNSLGVHIDQSCITCNVKVFVFRPPQDLGPWGCCLLLTPALFVCTTLIVPETGGIPRRPRMNVFEDTSKGSTKHPSCQSQASTSFATHFGSTRNSFGPAILYFLSVYLHHLVYLSLIEFDSSFSW